MASRNSLPASKGRVASGLKRMVSQSSQAQLTLRQRSTTGSDALYGKFAEFACRYPWYFILAGYAVGIIFTLGLLTAEKSSDINDLWIDTDSRVLDEKEDFDRRFGGAGRVLAVTLRNRYPGGEPSGVGNRKALAAHQLTAKDLFEVASIIDHGKNLTVEHFCEKPVVPALFKPGSPGTTAYAALTQCLSNQPLFVNVTWPIFLTAFGKKQTKYKPLPLSWGIDRFPCSRATPLDCFAEGGELDFPESLQTLQEAAPGVLFAQTLNVSMLIGQVVALMPKDKQLPCWLYSSPPSAKCLPGDLAKQTIDVITYSSTLIATQFEANTTDRSRLKELTLDMTSLAHSLVNDRVNRTKLNNFIEELQEVYVNVNIFLPLLIELERAKSASGDSALRQMVQSCIWEETAKSLDVTVAELDAAQQAEDEGNRTLAAKAVQARTTVNFLLPAFGTFGYWWRPSYKNMTNAQILEVYRVANLSEANPNIGVEQCILGAPQGLYCCLGWDGTKIGMQIWLGNVEKFLNGTFRSVSAYQSAVGTYDGRSRLWSEELLLETNRTYTAAETEKLAERFELHVMKTHWQPRYDRKEHSKFHDDEDYANYSMSYVTTRSISDILDEGTNVDDGPLLLSYLLMILFICFTLGKLPTSGNFQELINSHILLGVFGLTTVAFSTVAGLGFSAYTQIKFTPITSNLAPFVSLGLGVDDMFVLVFTMMHQFNPEDSIEVNMKRSMVLAGPSVFLTSMANGVAFLILSSTPTAMIFLFGLSAAINVFCNFLLLHLIFVPAIVLDTRRMLDNRLDVIPIKITPTPKIPMTPNNIENAERGSASKKEAALAVIKMATRSDSEVPLSDVIANALGDMLAMPIAKFCVIVISVVFTAVMLWSGIEHTEEGLNASDIAFKNSYQHDYAVLQEHTFPFEGAILMATSKNFSALQTQRQYLECIESISKSRWLMPGIRPKDLAWYTNSSTSLLGLTAAQSPPGSNITVSTPLPQHLFRQTRLQWMETLGSINHPDMVCVDVNDTSKWVDCAHSNSYLESAKIGVVFDNLRTIGDYRDMLRESRHLVDRHNKDGLRVYMIGDVYYVSELYLHMTDNALRTTGFTLLGVFFITFIFQFSPVLSLLVCLTVASVVVDVWGMFPVLGIKLNPFSVSNLAISVGLAVEFTAHIARAFAVAKGTHDERMKASLREMMVPMYQGAVSTIVAMAALATARSEFFIIYYSYTFLFMIIIAWAKGIFLLPVLLSLVGPAQFGETDLSANVQAMATIYESKERQEDTINRKMYL